MPGRCKGLIHNTAGDLVYCGAGLLTAEQRSAELCGLCLESEKENIRHAVGQQLRELALIFYTGGGIHGGRER